MSTSPLRQPIEATAIAMPPAEASVVMVSEDRVLDIIERAARDPQADIDKLERLIGLHERMGAARSKEAFNRAMRDAQAEMPTVVRDGKNDSTNSRYSKLETIAAACMPIITRHGFSLSFGTDVSPLEGHYRVLCECSHVGGHSRPYQADIPSDLVGMKGNANKTATHGFGSTMSYGRRYLTLLIFNVILVNEDNDGNANRGRGGDKITPGQLDQLVTLGKEVRANNDVFCAYFRIARVEDLPAIRFDDALRMLNAKKRMRQNGAGRGRVAS